MAVLIRGALPAVAIMLAVGAIVFLLSPSTGADPDAESVPTSSDQNPGDASGDVIEIPAAPYLDLTLVRAGSAPLMSQDDAIQIILDAGSPAVTSDNVRATYGLATFGQYDSRLDAWIGIQNVPMPSGDSLARIEDRPMWIVD